MIKRIPYLILGLVCCVTLAYGQQPPTFTVSPQNLTVDPDENVSFDITVSDFTDFVSFQYSMNWDPNVLEYVSVSDFNTDGFPGIGESNIGATNAIVNGEISVSWLENGLNAVTVPNGSAVYTINFLAIGSGSTSVVFSQSPSAFEVINSNDEDVGLNHEDANITVTGDVMTGNTDPLGLSVNNASGQNGTNICVPIRVSNFDDVNGAQFSINYDPAVLNYSSLQNFGVTGLDAADFTVPPSSSEGQISVNWSNPTGVSVNDNSTFVEVCFDIVGTAPASSTISFTGTPTPINVTTVASNGEDVGITPSTGTITVSSDSGTGGALEIIAGNASGETGTNVCIPVTVRNFNDIVSFQHSINYNSSVLSFTGVQNINLVDLSESGFGNPSPGNISVSWIDGNAEGVTLADNTVIYELCFDLISAGNATISFSGSPTAIEVTTVESNGQDIGLTPTSGSVTATGDGGGGGNDGELVVNAGNANGMTGTNVCVPVTVSNFNDIVSFQYSINYNSSVLNFTGVQNINLVGLAESSFNGNSPGNISVSWIDDTTNGVTLPDNTVLYELCFDLLNAGNSTISFSGSPSAIEVTTVESNGQDIGLDGNSGSVTVTGDGGGGGNDGELVMTAGSATGMTGTNVCIPVTVSNFNDIVSFQHSINYNSSVLNYTGVQNLNLVGLSEGGFGNPSPGNISVSWIDDNAAGITLADNTVIYELCFDLINGGTSTISFSGSPTSVEVTTVESNGQDIGLDGNSGNIVSEGMTTFDGLTFIAENQNVLPGEEFCVDVTVNDFTDLISFQYSMTWNSNVIQYTGVQGFGLPDLVEGSFGDAGVANGELTVSWIDDTTEGITVPNGTSIFQVCFTAVGNIGQSSGFNFGNMPTPTEVIDNQENLIDPDFSNGNVMIEDGVDPIDVVFNVTPPTEPVAIGNTFCMPLAVSNFTDITDMQITVNYPADLIQFSEAQITGNLPGLGTGQIDSSTPGQITINWTAPNGSETLPNGTVILNLCFTVLQAGPNNSATITFTNGVINNGDGASVDFDGPQVTIPLGNPPVIFPIAAGNVCGEPGEQVCVPVRTFNFDRLVSMQHTIEFDETLLEFESVNIIDNSIPDLAPSSFNASESNISQGRITFSWLNDDLGCVTVPDNTIIYELCFTVIGNVDQVSPIAFTNSPTAYEVADCDEVLLDWLGQDGQVEIGCSDCMPDVQETVIDVTCNGDMDGSISLVVEGCPGETANYAWSDGAPNSPNNTGLSAGNYTVTVSIGNETVIETYQVNEPSAVSTGNITPTDVSCFGNNNGTISLAPTGGAGNYTFSFNPGGATTNPATGLSPGTYSVTVMDGNNCMATADNIMVGGPAEALSVTSEATNVVCTGDATGTINLTVGGGTPQYTYAWSDGPSTDMNRTNLTAGTYIVTVTDNNTCTEIITTEVGTDTPAISISNVVTTPISGAGNNGAINVDVGGGTGGGFDYLWTGPNTYTAETEDISGLNDPGTYLLTVTDQSTSCQAFASVTLESPLSVNEGAAIVSSTCFGQTTGSVDITPMGGTPEYTYAWSNMTNNQDLVGVDAGSYTVTITDVAGTFVTATFEVGTTPEITVTGTVLPDTGASNGSVDVNVGGGIGPFNFLWSPGGSTDEDLFDQVAGTYTLTITDTGSGCVEIREYIIPLVEEPLDLAEITPQGVSCNGTEDGEVTLMIQGGSPDYRITFEPAIDGEPFFSSGAGLETYTGFGGGPHTAFIEDATGAMYSEMFIIPEPDAITLDENATQIFDAINTTNCDGAISLEVTGGIDPYTYMWTSTNGQVISTNGPNPGQLCPGEFTVVVIDANNCAQTITGLSVKEFTVQESGTSLTDPGCPGSATGMIDVTVINGAEPRTYSWTDETGTEVGTDEDLSGVAEGTYTLEVIDANGRTITRQYTLTAESNLAATAAVVSDFNGFGVRCADSTNAIARATALNGVMPFTYAWSDNLGTTETIMNVPAGLHTVTVTDNAGCATEATVMVTAPQAITIDLDVEGISCHDEDDGEIIAFASGGVGSFNYRWDDGANGSSRFNLEGGEYIIEVTDENGCKVNEAVDIVNPDVLTIEASATPITDTEPGSATVIVAGGTQPYTYSWNDGNNTETQTLENVTKEGRYVVIVSDKNGCVEVDEVEITLLADCLKSRPVITPTGEDNDNLNNEFIINCVENYPGNTLEVYNRWGQLVFEATDYDNTWEGTNRRGNPLPEGGYFYVLIYKDVSGQLTQLKGSLSILRQ